MKKKRPSRLEDKAINLRVRCLTTKTYPPKNLQEFRKDLDNKMPNKKRSSMFLLLLNMTKC